jgi:hypothetical protein
MSENTTKCEICSKNGHYYGVLNDFPMEIYLCIFCRELIKLDADSIDVLWYLHLNEFKASLKKLLNNEYVQ